MMSKRIHRLLALMSAPALAMAAFVFAGSTGVATAQRATVASSNARNLAIVAATTEVLKETSAIRELPILRPVKSGAQSRAEIERMLIRNLNEQMTPEEMHATEVSLRKFGLAPANFEYRPFIIKLLTEQVAGYYDPRMQTFHLADWLELEGQKPVMAHELTHALQDQHFNLRRFEKWPRGDSDAELAAHALIEGDATLAMTVYMAKNPLVALAFSRSLTAGVATEQYDQAPRAMRETLIFPYLQGSEWATQLYRRGGWAMVSRAFTRLPLSTEQILHAEKYLSYERPVKVLLPDLTSLLNAGGEQVGVGSRQSAIGSQQSAVGSPRNPGASHAAGVERGAIHGRVNRRSLTAAQRTLPAGAWHHIDTDVNGEWGYYLILDQFLNTAAESKRATAGWAGDRYALYEGPTGQVFVAESTAWDTENDAREFLDAYVKRTELRYPNATQVDASAMEPAARNSKLETGVRHSWRTSEGTVVLEQRGNRVVILEGIPADADSNALLQALWR